MKKFLTDGAESILNRAVQYCYVLYTYTAGYTGLYSNHTYTDIHCVVYLGLLVLYNCSIDWY